MFARQLITFTSFCLLSLPSLASVKVTVNGMVCSFCAQGIEKSFAKMEATKDVFVDLKNKVVVLEFKEGKSINSKIITQEINYAGYDVVKLETIPQTVQEFKAQANHKK